MEKQKAVTDVILSAAKNLDPVRGFEILHPDKSGFRPVLEHCEGMTKSVAFRQSIIETKLRYFLPEPVLAEDGGIAGSNMTVAVHVFL